MKKPESFCIDTHSLVWYFTGQKTLSETAKSLLDQLFFSTEITGFISIIVLLEIFHLSLKKPQFAYPVFLQHLKRVNLPIVSLDQTILTHAYSLPKNLDIHDRIIAATALYTKSILITKDRMLHQVKGLHTLW